MMTKAMMDTAMVFDGIKATPLNRLPPEAWTPMDSGERSKADPFILYENVPFIYRGVELRSNTLSSVPVGLFRNDEEVEAPDMVFEWWHQLPGLIGAWEADRCIYAAAYLYKAMNRRGNRTIGLRRFSPVTMEPQYSALDGLTGFKRTLSGQAVTVDVEEVVYSWIANRYMEEGPGTSPVMAAAVAAGLLKGSDLYSKSFFERGAVNPVLMKLKGGTQPQEAARVQNWLDRVLSGVANAFSVKAIATQGDWEMMELGSKMSDLAMTDLTQSKREDIATALGIPFTLLLSSSAGGMGGGGVRSQDTLDFITMTIIPEGAAFAEAINTQYLMGTGYELRFKWNELEVLQDDEADKANRLAALVDRGVITINEAREQLGLAPTTDDNIDTDDLERAESPSSVADDEVKHHHHHAPEPDSPTLTDINDHLSKWQTKAIKRRKEGQEGIVPFKSEYIPDGYTEALEERIALAVTEDDIKAAFNVKTQDDYRRSLRSSVRALHSGRIDPFTFVGNFNSIIEFHLTQAWEAGMELAGFAMGDMSTEEQAALRQAVITQQQFVPGLTTDIQIANIEGKPLSHFDSRLDMWANRWGETMEQARLMARADAKLVWRMGATEQHCVDCESYNGRVYRASTWARYDIRPKHTTLACFGGHCDCRFEDASDMRLTSGRPPAPSRG